MKMSIKERWSVRDLSLHIDLNLFEKRALKQTNFDETLSIKDLSKNNQEDISILVKDSYDFSFLDLEELRISLLHRFFLTF